MEELEMFKTAFKKRHLAAALMCGIICLPLLAQTPSTSKAHSRATMDYASTQEDILRFETVLNDVINSAFSTSPFAVVQKAKGAYLRGYGVSFSFLINIHRAVIKTPFGQVRRGRGADVTPAQKNQIIEELKEKLIQILQSNGDTFRQLGKEEHVTIIAFFEDRNIPDEPNANKTIVLSALKKDLDEFENRNDRISEFKQRMQIVEY
jgi:hypothetical protein